MRLPRPALLLLCTAACGADPAPDLPPLPPLDLQPRAPALEALTAAAPAPLTDERRTEVIELLELAFIPNRAAARIVTMSKRSVLEAEDAMQALEAGLGHEHLAVRTNAAYELGALGRQPAVVPLLKALKYELDPGGKVWIASALATLGIRAGLPALIEGMQRGDIAQAAGHQAIAICKAAEVPLSEQPTYVELGDALGRLHAQWLEDGAIPQPADDATTARLAQLLLDLEGFQLRPVDEARFMIGHAGALGLPLLRTALGADERYLRQHAIEIVRRLGRAARTLGPELLPLLGDPLSRADAARTLGAIGEAAAYPHLVAMLEETDPELRAAAAGALGPLGDDRAVPHLEAIVADDAAPMDVRVQAAFSLGIFELRRPARAFLQGLRDRGEYHGPTLDEMLDALDRRAR